MKTQILLLLLVGLSPSIYVAAKAKQPGVRASSSRSFSKVPNVRPSIPRGGATAAAWKNKLNRPSKLETGQEQIPEGTATIPAEIFNLVKTIVGAGVLGLPSGIVALGDQTSAILPAIVFIVTIAMFSAYGFATVGLVCSRTKSTSYRQAWSRSVGEATSWVPALACTLVTTCSVLCYSIILSDTIPAVLQAVTGGIIQLSRTQTLLGVTSTILLPLCLMKDLKSLAPFSLVGIIAMIYTSLAMLYRWLIASPTLATATDTAETVAQVLSTSDNTVWWKLMFKPSASILISMLSTAFMAHYNAPKFYWELAQRSTPRYNRVVANSFVGATFLMATVAAAGFGTFGAASKGMILNNYPVDDKLMALSRLAVTISLICSYPLAFVGVRDGVLDLGGVTDRTRRNGLFVPLTSVLLLVVTAVAFVVKDISIIMALGGATWGNALIYLFPAFMLIQLANKQQDLKKEVPLAILTGGIGLFLAVVGTSTAIKKL